ncbi:hypothetical protein KM043_005052 [Ampulex compressa]|nr:hypothetical protein KM043_005052 [Ampulex compressa]
MERPGLLEKLYLEEQRSGMETFTQSAVVRMEMRDGKVRQMALDITEITLTDSKCLLVYHFFVEAELLNSPPVNSLLSMRRIPGVIIVAGSKAPGKSSSTSSGRAIIGGAFNWATKLWLAVYQATKLLISGWTRLSGEIKFEGRRSESVLSQH